MSYIKEQVAYIRGLAEGMELGNETKEAKILNAMLLLLDEMAGQIDESHEFMDDMRDSIEGIASDLSDLEDIIYDLDDDSDEDPLIDEEDEMDDFLELQCPHCGDSIYFDRTLIEEKGDLICPSCSRSVIVVDDGEH